MKVTSNEKTAVNTVEIHVLVSAAKLEESIEKMYLKNREKINIQGFRKGKASRKTIEKMYGAAVFLEDAVNDLYPEAYAFAIDETGIEPVAPGDVEVLEADVEDGFTFKATVTVKPEVTVSDYKGLSANNVVRVASDERVDEEIARLRERGSREVDVQDRAAQDGDIAIIDYEGFLGDSPFEGGKDENHRLALGSNSFIAGFEEQIVGHNTGESFDVEVTFPEEYHSEDLAGKPAMFKVTLHELKVKELPALDDEFAKDVSEFDTLVELKEDARKTMQEKLDKISRDELENSLVERIIDNLEGEIPEIMYSGRVDQLVEEFAQRLAQQGMNIDLYLQYTDMEMESFRKTFREQAQRQVKTRLALEKIVQVENIVPTGEDLEKEYQNMSEQYKRPVEELKKLVHDSDLTKDVATSLAIDLIHDTAVVTNITEEDKKIADEKERAAKEKESKIEESSDENEEN